MQAVKSAHTAPEMVVRRLLHGLGYRYRLHDRRLPGTPDLVFAGRGKVVFVHGCFWHRHDCPAGRKEPKSNRGYWLPKLAKNATRDRDTEERLRRSGWEVLTLWQCELRDPEALAAALVAFLGPPKSLA